MTMKPEGKKLECHICNYRWTYKGKRKIAASCPDCKGQVKFKR